MIIYIEEKKKLKKFSYDWTIW